MNVSPWLTLSFGSVTVRAGDQVIADETGIVVVPASRLPEALSVAEGLLGSDLAFEDAISSGAVHTAQARAEFVHGLNDILLVATFVALAGAVLAFALVRARDFVASAPQPA